MKELFTLPTHKIFSIDLSRPPADPTHLTLPISSVQPIPRKNVHKSLDIQSTLLIAAIESFTVGLVIVGWNRKILHHNKYAQDLLHKISHPSSHVIPKILWDICHRLIEDHNESSNDLSKNQTTILEDEIPIDHRNIHIQVQQFKWRSYGYHSREFFLITLEDRQKRLTTIVDQEAQDYKLTPREAEVWHLKRLNHSYKEISNILFISENTVKKHVKNIHAKKKRTNKTT